MIGPFTYTKCEAPTPTEEWWGDAWKMPDDTKNPKEMLTCINWKAPNGDRYIEMSDGRWFFLPKEKDGKRLPTLS